jgi:hypothetical protein
MNNLPINQAKKYQTIFLIDYSDNGKIMGLEILTLFYRYLIYQFLSKSNLPINMLILIQDLRLRSL